MLLSRSVFFFYFFFSDPPTTEIYTFSHTLSLPVALPIYARFLAEQGVDVSGLLDQADALRRDGATAIFVAIDGRAARSEEHTSELQSLMRITYAVYC